MCRRLRRICCARAAIRFALPAAGQCVLADPEAGSVDVGFDLLRLLAEALDAEAHGLAGLQEDRVRLHAHADAGRRAGGDDVAGLQGHELADVADELGDAEDHRLGRAVLAAVAVDLEPHVEVLRVGDFVVGDEPGADRAEGVAALALVPLAAALDLEFALAETSLTTQ